MRHVLGLSLTLALILAALASPVRADNTEALCATSAEPAKAIAACTAVVGEPVLRASARAKAYAARGWARMRGDDRPGARADFDAAVTLDGNNISALLGRGTADGRDGHAVAALADFAQIEKLEPDNTALHVNRAQFFISQHRYGEALADAEFQRYGYGYGSTFLNLRCRARAYGGIDLDKASQACGQALWLQPDAPTLVEALGIVALKQKHFEAALSDFRKLSTLEPNAARGWYGQGLAEAGLGQSAQAQADITKAQRLNADVTRIFDGFGLPQV